MNLRTRITTALGTAVVGTGLLLSGAAPAQAADFDTVTNHCIHTKLSIQVITKVGTFTLPCGTSRREVGSVKTLHPTRITQSGVTRCYGAGRIVDVYAPASVYTVPGC